MCLPSVTLPRLFWQTIVNGQSEWNLPSGNFAYHLHKPLMNWLLIVNLKNISEVKRFSSSACICSLLVTSFFLLPFFLVQDSMDYQGRSYLHIPKDIDIKLDTDQPPERCYLPKKHIHTW